MTTTERWCAPRVLYTLAGLTITLLVCANTAPAEPATRSASVHTYAIPAGPLSTVLTRFATESGLALSFDAKLTAGKTSPGLQGRFTRQQALSRLLDGSGVIHRFTSDSTLTLERAPVVRDNGPVALGPIVVTGELQQRTLQDAQSSVAVFTGEELDQSPDHDLFDLADRTPNVTQQGGGFGFTIRGIAEGGVGNIGSGSTINVTVDGASIPPAQSVRTGPTSTWDLAQAEILRGPQSTQRGRNALAGAIVVRTQDPVFAREFKGRADYGSFDETRFAVAGNLPLVEDTLAVRVAAEDYRSDGDIKDRFTGEDVGDGSLRTVRGKVRYQPTDRLDIVLGHTVTENEFSGQSIDPDVWPQRRVNSSPQEVKGDNDLTNLRVAYTFSPAWSIDAETSYFTNDYELFQTANPADPNGANGERLIDESAFSQELRVKYAGGGLDAVLGAYYAKTHRDLTFEAEVADATVFLPVPPGTSARFGNTEDTDVENYAVFGEVEYRFLPDWRVIAGARYDNEQRDTLLSSSTVLIPPIIPIPSSPPQESSASYDAFLPKLGIVYDWNDNISHGITVQRGYRAGGSGVEFGTGRPFEFDPEFTTNYEYSLRSTWLDERLTINANLFYTQWEDQQVTTPGPSGTFLDSTIENAGESELYGGELETRFLATNNLDLFFNLGYVKTKFVDFPSRDQAGNPINLEGNEFPQAPRLTGAVGGSYYFPKGYEIHLNGSYTDQSYYTANNDPGELSDSFFLVNARVGYQADDWSVFAYARNLFDKQYLSRRRVDNADTAGDSRVVGVSVAVEF